MDYLEQLKQAASEILEKTNGGLDIIREYYDIPNINHTFKIREERTPSASIKLVGNVYVVCDFGGDQVKRNAILVCAHEEGLEWKDAVLLLASQYNVSLESVNPSQLMPTIKEKHISDIDFELEENGYYFQTRDFTEEELKVLGPKATQDICHRYKLYCLEFYARKSKKNTNNVKFFYSNEHYPIFCFINKYKDKEERWYKLYQPKSLNPGFRFMHVGGREKGFIFGLDYIKAYVHEKRKKEEDELNKDREKDSTEEKKSSSWKLDRICIATGGRDALNLASLGEFPIWFNSETKSIDSYTYNTLSSNYCKEFINIPDVDTTGKREGIKMAMKFHELKTAWLDDELGESFDFRGKKHKDFTDFVRLNSFHPGSLQHKVNRFLDLACPVKFWDAYIQPKTGLTMYSFNNVNAYYFLQCAGFHRIDQPEKKEEYTYIRLENHIVEETSTIKIKNYINLFLEKKQRDLGSNKIPEKLRNYFYSSDKMSDNSLSNLKTIDLNFKDSTEKSQLLFFKKKVWKVTAEGIEELVPEKMETYVWEDNIIDNRIKNLHDYDFPTNKLKLLEDLFVITEPEKEEYDIEIKEKNCEFLNYLINGSRVFWKKEIEEYFEEKPDAERENYFKKHQFDIAGPNLSEDEKLTQKTHLINKIYCFGYLMHKHKMSSRPWGVYIMDDKVVDEDESHGGTGKSLYSKALFVFLRERLIASRTGNVFEDKHLYDGVTKDTDYILFDDANKRFKIDALYTALTGPMNVNPKNNKPYTIRFLDSPKIAISSNYSLRNTDPSTMRRFIFGAFSDWYHKKGNEDEYRRSWAPEDDFGHDFFEKWNPEQWNLFFNFSAQCLKFYLSCKKPIQAPMDNIQKRNLLSEMGVSFLDWADRYFEIPFNESGTRFGQLFVKDLLLEDCTKNTQSLKQITSNSFKKKLKAWCKYHGHIFNPETHPGASYTYTKEGRIMKKDSLGVTKEYILIQHRDDLLDKEIESDLPF